MSEANKAQEQAAASKKGQGFASVLLDNAKSIAGGAIAGVGFIGGLVAGLLGSIILLGASAGSALVFSGVAALLTAQGTEKVLKPKNKFSFYASALLTVVALSGKFNTAATPPVNKDIEVNNQPKYEEVVKNSNVFYAIYRPESTSHKTVLKRI